jgi:hypothetical protein
MLHYLPEALTVVGVVVAGWSIRRVGRGLLAGGPLRNEQNYPREQIRRVSRVVRRTGQLPKDPALKQIAIDWATLRHRTAQFQPISFPFARPAADSLFLVFDTSGDRSSRGNSGCLGDLDDPF